MKSNFEFLGRYWPALAEIGKTAEPFVLPVKEPDVDYALIIEAQERKIAALGQQATVAPTTAADATYAERQEYEEIIRFP